MWEIRFRLRLCRRSHGLINIFIHELFPFFFFFFLFPVTLLFLSLMVGPLGFDPAAVTVTTKAIVLPQPFLPAGKILVNGEITQANFPSLWNIMDHSNDDISIVAVVIKGRSGIDIVKPTRIGKAIVIE
uniref:Uncharacterized protein n=1 Tax=Cannabis sativa TaxID=3483 RepID=A0A803QZQ4_CANSA